MSSNFTNYQIYYKLSIDSSYVYYSTSSNTKFTIKDLSSNTKYYFRLIPYSTISNLCGDYIDISYSTNISLDWADKSGISAANLLFYYPFSDNIYNYASKLEDAISYNGANISGGSLSLTSTSSSNIQYIQLPSFTNTTNGMTFSFWIKYSSATNWARIFDFGNGANNNNVFISFIGGLPIIYGGYGTYYNNDGTNFGTLSLNTWTHVAQTITYNNSMNASTTSCYINGISVVSGVITGYPDITTRIQNYIGLNNQGNPEGYFGSANIADFRYYNRTLLNSSDYPEISTLAKYNNPINKITTFTLGGRTITDISLNWTGYYTSAIISFDSSSILITTPSTSISTQRNITITKFTLNSSQTFTITPYIGLNGTGLSGSSKQLSVSLKGISTYISGLKFTIYDGSFNDTNFTFFSTATQIDIPSPTGYTTNFSNILTATDNKISIDGATNYSILWEGRFNVPTNDTYTFYLRSSGTSYLFISRNNIGTNTEFSSLSPYYIINNSIINASNLSISLIAGTYYYIKIIYTQKQNNNLSDIKLYYKKTLDASSTNIYNGVESYFFG